jgi:hypothetical protein
MLTLLLITATSLVVAVWSFSVALMDRGATADRLDEMVRRLDSIAADVETARRDIQRRARRRARQEAA